jgi:hypothetical protein
VGRREAMAVDVIRPIRCENNQGTGQAGRREGIDSGDVVAGKWQERDDDAAHLNAAHHMPQWPVPFGNSSLLVRLRICIR